MTTEIGRLKNDIARLEAELHLEKTWAEGEIDFWREQCKRAEEELARLKGNKPWWRMIIS